MADTLRPPRELKRSLLTSHSSQPILLHLVCKLACIPLTCKPIAPLKSHAGCPCSDNEDTAVEPITSFSSISGSSGVEHWFFKVNTKGSWTQYICIWIHEILFKHVSLTYSIYNILLFSHMSQQAGSVFVLFVCIQKSLNYHLTLVQGV